MAGVKTKREGASKPPRFSPTDCYGCGLGITKLADGILVLRVAYEGVKRSSQKSWAHRRCVGSEGGKK
jgi:hypothetical protein